MSKFTICRKFSPGEVALLSRRTQELEREIEILREKLYGDHPLQGLRPLDPQTYALSVRLDKLILRYYRLKKKEGP
jgi:hypothetical protein